MIESITSMAGARLRASGGIGLALAAAALMLFAGALDAQAPHQTPADDPRVGLGAGWLDAEEAAWNMEIMATLPRPPGFFDSENLGNLNLANSDLAFRDNLLFVGNFHGFMIYDISNPSNPILRTSFICPGGQGDLSVYGNLLFMSVEQGRGRIDCGTQGTSGPVDAERFRGVRIFDISNLDSPRQIAAVQTCRGSHTHSLVKHPGDDNNLYVYVSGSAGVRPAAELAGCSGASPDEDPDATSLFRIEIIEVPLHLPAAARVVNAPRVFADQATGRVDGLWPGGVHGEDTQRSAQTNHCHDITTFPAIGLAAGACSGNGILFDISDPVNPERIHEVIDTNFAYWHSATFNNDGTTVIFTDEWGGGTSPRCRAEDRPEWGANAIFRIVDGEMEFASYFKIPAAQTAQENCVAHNGSLVPVPGRDIKVQAWYQGGVSVFDFTDPANPVEIAFFDRGPIDAERLVTGGYWSTYWYNGAIYGSEIARGLDVLRLTPSEYLTQNEIDAANLVRWDKFNPQHQPKMTWPAAFPVARAYLDQLERSGAVASAEAMELRTVMARAEQAGGVDRGAALDALAAAAAPLAERAGTAEGIDATRFENLAETIEALAASLR